MDFTINNIKYVPGTSWDNEHNASKGLTFKASVNDNEYVFGFESKLHWGEDISIWPDKSFVIKYCTDYLSDEINNKDCINILKKLCLNLISLNTPQSQPTQI